MQKQQQDFLAVVSTVIMGIGYIGFKFAKLHPYNPIYIAIIGTITIIVMAVSAILMSTMAPDPFKEEKH